jgi:choline dehydrogenase-like flavoprotein
MRIANASGLNRQPEFARFRGDGLSARRTSAQPPRPYNRGRVLGGSSAVNGLVAIRGTPDDFDRWAAEGCAGWAWADVLPAFIRLEDDLNFGDAAYHGRGGPIPVWRAPLSEWGAVDLALRSAALDLGHPWSETTMPQTLASRPSPSTAAPAGVSRPPTATSNPPAGVRT